MQVWSLAGGALLRTVVLPAALTCVALDPAEWCVYAGAVSGADSSAHGLPFIGSTVHSLCCFRLLTSKDKQHSASLAPL